MRISDWSSDVCSSDLPGAAPQRAVPLGRGALRRQAARRPGGAREHADPDADGARRRELRAPRGRLAGGRPGVVLREVHHRRRPARPDADLLQRLRPQRERSEEHTSELQSLMRISYAVFCLKNKNSTLLSYYHTSSYL